MAVITIPEGVAPSTPAAGKVSLYAKTADHKIYYKDDTGTEYGPLDAGSSMVYPGAGIPNSTGSAWGTSYTITGSGTILAAQTSPVLITPAVKGSSTGKTTLASANASASDYTATLQAATGTVAYLTDITGTNSGTNTGDQTPTSLGLVIGTDVQAYDADLTTWAGVTPGAGVATFIATPTIANLNSAVSDADLATLSGTETLTAKTLLSVKDTVYNITDGAAFEIDPANGNIQTITLGASRTPAATNFVAGQAILLGIDDGTAYSITWSTVAVTWVKSGGTASAPTLATSGYTWVLLWKVSSTIYGAIVGSP